MASVDHQNQLGELLTGRRDKRQASAESGGPAPHRPFDKLFSVRASRGCGT